MSTATSRTFLFTDIEGSTRLWERHRDAMGAVIARHDALLQSVMRGHDGHIFKTIGDAFCVAFRDAGAALAAAVEAQASLRAAAWDGIDRVPVRMAIHSGEVEERDDDYFGLTVNRVARLLGIGHGDMILVSAATMAALPDELPKGVELRDLGRHKLKDLSRPEHVFGVVHPALPADFAPLRSLDAFPNNLPQQLTSFVGRENELAEIRVAIRDARLVTLTGAGGCGKTRLAIHAAAEALGAFRDGVWFVELAPLPNPDLVMRAIALALRISPERERKLVETLGEALRRKKLLLVLDNCEHVIDAVARAATDLLGRTADVHILATSREPLRITAESVLAVPPLPVPDESVSAAELERYDAVGLFLDRARAVSPHFKVCDEEAPAVARLCRQLDGIPLALELAAARVRMLDPHGLAERLADRFRLLSVGDRAAVPRHQTLRAAIDWSYDLLPTEQRLLLCRLSVFHGGWTLEAARALRRDGDEPVFETLERLVDQSLVIADESKRGARRYRLLETIRAYAAQRLLETESSTDDRTRHARYYAGLVTNARPHLTGEDAEEWHERLEDDLDNLRAALAWASRITELFETGMRMAADLWSFCWVRGFIPEGRRWLAMFLDADRDHQVTPAFAKALYAAGVLAKEGGDLRAARSHYERNLEARTELDDEPGRSRAMTLSALANVVRLEGDSTEAKKLYEEALAIQRAHGDPVGVAGTLNGLGNVFQTTRDFEGARTIRQECLDLFRRARNVVGEKVALQNLAETEFALGNPRAARRMHRKALALCRRLGDERGAAMSRLCVGQDQLAAKRYRRARVLLRASLIASHELMDQQSLVDAFESMAQLAEAAGHRDRAERVYGAMEALCEQIGIPVPDEVTAAHPSAARREGRALSLEDAVAYATSP